MTDKMLIETTQKKVHQIAAIYGVLLDEKTTDLIQEAYIEGLIDGMGEARRIINQ